MGLLALCGRVGFHRDAQEGSLGGRGHGVALCGNGPQRPQCNPPNANRTASRAAQSASHISVPAAAQNKNGDGSISPSENTRQLRAARGGRGRSPQRNSSAGPATPTMNSKRLGSTQWPSHSAEGTHPPRPPWPSHSAKGTFLSLPPPKPSRPPGNIDAPRSSEYTANRWETQKTRTKTDAVLASPPDASSASRASVGWPVKPPLGASSRRRGG